MNQCCLHKSRVVHERGKRNQTQMACYIYFSGKGQMVAKVVANGLSHNFSNDWLWTVHQSTVITSLITSWGWFAIGGNNLSDLPPNGKSPSGLSPNGINASVAKPFLLACSMLCFHFASTLHPLCIHFASCLDPLCFLFASCFLLFTLWLRLLPCADAQSSHAYFQHVP